MLLRAHRYTLPLLTIAWLACDGPSDGEDAGSNDGALPDAPRDAQSADSGAGVPPPPAPVFPTTIGTLSIAVRTSSIAESNTDAAIELCLNGTRCIELDTPDVNDRELGTIEVLHFEGFNLPRSEVTEVTLRTTDDPLVDNDRWSPECLELRFDGEPVYCNDAIGAHIGTGNTTGEVISWSDPDRLHQGCVTCQTGTLTHGPIQGANDPDRLRVWARTDATRLVGLRVGTSADLSSAPVLAWAYPTPQNDFTTVLEVDGLAPSTEYFVRVEVEDSTSSPIRSARTAPPAESRLPVQFAFGSCTLFDAQPIFDRVTALEPELFLFIGDNHYGNTSYLEAHRWRYRAFHAVPERAAMMAAVPSIATWDDHDFVGNNSTATCAGRSEALRGFREYWTNPDYGLPATPGTFFTHRHGPMELFVLDCRTYRPDVGDPGRVCTDDPTATSPPISAGPLGAAQEAWLLDALSASDATFKLIACGSQWTAMSGFQDSWGSFSEARARLFDAIDARAIGGVVLLSGDLHRSEVRMIARAGSWSIPELTSSPMANDPYPCPAVNDSETSFCYDTANSFITIDIDPSIADPTLTARVRGETGQVLYEATYLRSSLGP